MEEKRPDPNEILAQIKQAEEENTSGNKKGKLKIFLGYCAGVGKTYRMLQEAGANKKNGIDVVVAYAETHGRKETDVLLNGHEIMPRKKIEYSGLTLDEMDIDKVLIRHPALVIVDELAHTNIPGSRHVRRYQDVEEFLNVGIDVFTTLNIQHIESLNDMVQQISGIKMKETVPDTMIERANEVELVDLTPEKLLERLKEGKVYIPQKAEQAMRQFFRRGNLLALRELSLSYTAKHVDEDFRLYMEKHAIPGPWPVGSRLLVGISASPTTGRLLRFTHRLAQDLDAEWFAAYVESPQQLQMNEKAKILLDENIHLAEQLGARVVPLSGNNVADEILEFARSKKITLILTGTPKRTRFQEIFKGTIVNELIEKSGPIHVLVMGEEEYEKAVKEKYYPVRKKDWRAYVFAFLMIAVVTSLAWLFRYEIEPINIGMLLLLPAIASGILWGIRAGLFASLVAVCVFDFFFVPPYLTFRIADLRYLPSFIVFVVVSVTISYLAKSIREKAELSAHRERFVYSLYSFTKTMMTAENLDDVLDKAVKNISEAFESDVIISLPDSSVALKLRASSADGFLLSETENAVASWVFANGKSAGKNTDTLSSALWYYLPLIVQDEIVGVVGLKALKKDSFLSPEQNQLLESFAGVVALSVKRVSEKR